MSPRWVLLTLSAALAMACTPAIEQTGVRAPAKAASAPPLLTPADLPSFFDCLRESGATIVSAHRGGPQPGFPENALETLQHTLAAAPVALEVDISRTRDGVLVLMHDDSLDRTSTGTGLITEKTYAELADVRLQDRAGQVTGFAIPRLEEVLSWAKGRTILQLDVKRGVPFEEVVAAVHAAGVEENALIITYNDRDAARVSALDPGLYLSAQARSREDAAALRRAKVRLQSVGGWTGTDAPDPAVFAALRAEGLEPFFGTLGRPGERLDDQYAAENGAGWVRLSQAGLALIASDRPIEAFAALDAADGPGVKWAGCLLAK
jgi:glycerophosphoryl diester phosphodiesterase